MKDRITILAVALAAAVVGAGCGSADEIEEEVDGSSSALTFKPGSNGISVGQNGPCAAQPDSYAQGELGGFAYGFENQGNVILTLRKTGAAPNLKPIQVSMEIRHQGKSATYTLTDAQRLTTLAEEQSLTLPFTNRLTDGARISAAAVFSDLTSECVEFTVQ